jgi:predicted PurR-regulated permease PerM
VLPVAVNWNIDLSDDAVGVLLLLATILFVGVGALLAKLAIDKTARAAADANEAAQKTKEATANAIQAAVYSNLNPPRFAAQTQEITQSTASLSGTLTALEKALESMTGFFTAARFCFVLASLTVLAALGAFHLVNIDLSAGDMTQPGTTTPSTPTPPSR